MTAENRIGQLKAEFEKGQLELARLEQRRREVCDTMLRISGAIQVLQEQVLEEMEDGQRQHATLAGVCPSLS